MKLATRRCIVALSATALLWIASPAAGADFQQAINYFKAGKYVEAAAEFQALVDQSPEYDYGYFILGLSFLKMNKLPDAEKNFRKALELNADRFEYHHGLANSLMGRKRYREVVQALDPAEGLATEADTKYALYSMRGFAYASQKKWAEAIGDLEKARAIKKSASVLVQLGKAYYALGHNDKAVPLFREALKSNPNNAGTQQLMAEACIKLGKEARSAELKKKYYQDAVQAAEKCRSLKPGSYDSVNLVGKAALGAGDYPKAEQAFKQVLSMKPDYCYAMINLGKTYIAQGQWKAAERPLQDAVKCAPRMSTIYESLGLIYQKYGKQAQEEKSYDKALGHYEQALKHYDEATKIKSSSFVEEAIKTINENKQVIEHNIQASEEEREVEEALRKEQERIAEEERKRKEWEKKRKRDN